MATTEAVKRLRLIVTDQGIQQTTDKLKNLAKAQRDIGASVKDTGSLIDQAQSKLSSLASSGGLLSTALGVGAGLAGFAAIQAGISAAVGSVGEAVTAFSKFQDTQVTLQNTIRATGGAAGSRDGRAQTR